MNTQAYKDLEDLAVMGFLCLRKYAYAMLWALHSLFAQQHIRGELVLSLDWRMHDFQHI
jgi:hypothetical protein